MTDDRGSVRSPDADDEARVLQHVRDEIWRMAEPDDVEGVLRAVRDGLRTLGVDFHGIGINNVTEDRERVHHFSFAGEESMRTTSSEPTLTQRIVDFMEADHPSYRADLLADDPWDEHDRIVTDWGDKVRCIIDVPFESGTLALNSPTPNAFSPADQSVLSRMAVALQEGFRRLRDLQALQERSREAEGLAAERQEALDHEVILGEIRDRVQSMRTLRDAPLRSDWMKILDKLGVPVNGMSVQFPGDTPGYYTSTGLSASSFFDDVPLEIHPWVSRAWETGESVLVHAAELEHSGFDNWPECPLCQYRVRHLDLKIY